MNSKRVIISGASGLIGSALSSSLRAQGVSVTHLVRSSPLTRDEIAWNPESEHLDASLIADFDVVVNLNGASIAKIPWTKKYRKVLRSSRLSSTKAIAQAVNKLGDQAPHFISASAVGYYGSQAGVALTENSGPGDSFLARMCSQWENTALSHAQNARVSLLRTAPILHPKAVLKPLIALTRLGFAGPLGSGHQIWPWISLEDEVRAIEHIMKMDLFGPVNLSGPTAASANEIGRDLARQLHRPFFVTAPAFALRLALSPDAANGLLLADANVVPDRLLSSGFSFKHQKPAEAIEAGLEALP